MSKGVTAGGTGGKRAVSNGAQGSRVVANVSWFQAQLLMAMWDSLYLALTSKLSITKYLGW